MQPVDFLYFLTDDAGRSYYVENGIVPPPSSTPVPLPVTPDGWQDKTIKYNRNLKASSLWRTYTNPLKFVKQGALIVRHFLYTNGTEAKINLLIHRLDKKYTGGWIHRFFYKGELDLSQVEDTDSSIQVNVMEGGLTKLLKANENTQYEIDVDVPEAVVVKMDGLFLYEKQNFVVPGDISLLGDHLLYVSFVNREGSAFGIQPFSVFGYSGLPTFENSADYFLGASIELIAMINISGSISFSANSGPFAHNIYLRTNTGREIPLGGTSGTSSGQTFTIPFNVTFDTFEGETFFLAGETVNNITYKDSQFTISFKSRYKTTYIKGLRPAYVAQKLLDKITGGGYIFTSAHLTAVWENLLITSGDAIRGFENAKLKISWNDFFDSYNVPCNLCYGIRNGELYIEEKAKAFQPTILQAMGEVRDLVVSTAKDYQYNTVSIGYPNTDTEDVNGRDEFNVTQIYTSPITRVSKTLDLVSKVRASMYEIELTRINLDGRDTTDDNNDSRSFFLHVEKAATAGAGDEPASYFKLFRDTYDSITGILDPNTAFNIELHPELCLKRHGNFLHGIFYWNDAGTLDFQTSDKNGNMVVTKDGQLYIGNKNIQIVSLDPALFIPLNFKYDSPMPDDTIETMDAGPDGTFSVQYSGDTYYGFPMEVGIQPANRPAQETTLLCSPQTDLTKLITMSR